MERNIQANTNADNALLIDFSSPEPKHRLFSPLIPVPRVTNSLAMCSLNSNPFDIIAEQVIPLSTSNNDPFDCVPNTAFNKLNGDNKENVGYKISSVTIGNQSTTGESGWDNSKKKPIIELNKPNCDITDIEVKKSNNLVEASKQINEEITKLSFTHIRQSEDNSSRISDDFSTEEGLKAVIARRVNNCIQKVLHKTTNNCDSNKSKAVQTSDKKVVNRQSQSFSTKCTAKEGCERLNKSCSEACCSPVTKTMECFNTMDNLLGFCDVTPISFPSLEDTNDGGISDTTEQDQVLQEANKLAFTFSKIAQGFHKEEAGNEEEDLLNCKPQWSFADSSEDEEEKLRKDPALNIRVNLTNPMTPSQPDHQDSKALSEFKSKYRRSYSILQGNIQSNDSTLKRSLSIGSRPFIASVFPTVASSVAVGLEEQDVNTMKLKKKPLAQSKKGPMRAVMPVQTMAKGSLTAGVEVGRQRDKSPVKKNDSSQLMVSPIKDSSQLNIRPVASSTPNKCSYIPSPAQVVVPDKRHSFDSATQQRKSRPPAEEPGSRHRSNSANCGNVSGTPSQIRTLGPRSTSNLLPNSAKAKAGTVQSKAPAKQLTKGSTNVKPPKEVKPKISGPSRIRSSVSAITNMISGRSKKAGVRGKENRDPV